MWLVELIGLVLLLMCECVMVFVEMLVLLCVYNEMVVVDDGWMSMLFGIMLMIDVGMWMFVLLYGLLWWVFVLCELV